MSTVIVMSHPETGKVVTPFASNPEYGSTRVESEEVITYTNGFMNSQKRVAFLRGRVSLLEQHLTEGQELQGKIIKRESFQPFYEGQDPKINPSTGEIILTEGKQTYLDYQFTDDLSATDEWVEVTEPVEAARL